MEYFEKKIKEAYSDYKQANHSYYNKVEDLTTDYNVIKADLYITIETLTDFIDTFDLWHIYMVFAEDHEFNEYQGTINLIKEINKKVGRPFRKPSSKRFAYFIYLAQIEEKFPLFKSKRKEKDLRRIAVHCEYPITANGKSKFHQYYYEAQKGEAEPWILEILLPLVKKLP